MKRKTGKDEDNLKSVKKKKSENRELHVIMYLFVVLFLCMMGYFGYYVQFRSVDEVNNSYNTRQENLAVKVIRGKILSQDKQILAETVRNSKGEEERFYPFGDTFAHVVGFSTRGKTGIEGMENISLLTSNAYVVEQIQNNIAEQKNMGDNIVTTLDVKLQQVASEALGVYKGAIVVMEPDTGKILAMVSKPDFDPNTIAEQWDELDAMKDKSPLLNRATQGLYPPGSVFKIVTLLEYLKENDDPDAYQFTCNGAFSYEGVTVKCYHGSVHGRENLMDSFSKSCNCSFANIGTLLQPQSFQKTCQELLFNQKLPLKLPYSKSSFSYSDSNDPEEVLHTAIGQGKTLVTPVHMAMITAAIANEGELYKPYLVSQIENYQGAVIKQYKPDKYKRLMEQSEADTLKQYMQKVVENGTGKKLKGLSYTVAGKTGSAEYGSEKGESHAWFTGFSNVDNPDIVVTVIVEGAGSGSDYAVPMAKRIFDAYYN